MQGVLQAQTASCEGVCKNERPGPLRLHPPFPLLFLGRTRIQIQTVFL